MIILDKILNIGNSSNLRAEAKRIRILNGIAFFAALILIFNGFMIFIGSYPFENFTLKELVQYLMTDPEIKIAQVKKFRIIFPVLDFILASLAFVSLLLNYFRKYKTSSLVILLIANFYVAFFYWFSGYFSVFFFFIPALLPIVFFKRTQQYLPYLGLTLLIFVVLTIVKFNNGINDLFLQPPADKALINSLLNFSAVFAIVLVIIIHFKKENVRNEKVLEEKNKILDLQSKEIKTQRDELYENNIKLSASEEELKESNATKDKFISILAHDLRSPFQYLLGFSELLMENFNDYDKHRIEEQINAIYQTSKTTYELLDQILLWANTHSGKLTIKPEKFNFLEITNSVVNEFKNQSDKKNIKINLNENKKLSVKADLNIFKTVMRNLITNALKFTNQNGEINILAETDNQNLTITISDNGIGISEDVMPKLWEIEEDYTTLGTNNEKGTGFGLKLCKELINKHGGKIWVESEIGKGSDFKFTIPVHDD